MWSVKEGIVGIRKFVAAFSLMVSLTLCAAACVPSTLEIPISRSALLPTEEIQLNGLSDDEIATLSSFEQVDEYPLYTMRFYGSQEQRYSIEADNWLTVNGSPSSRYRSPSTTEWSCSLFAALGDINNMIYGRNFDWEYSPALILFTNPPDGYASISMVDIAYLGFGSGRADNLTELPIGDRRALLNAINLPFDGMNEHGLVVGMAAVPPGQMAANPEKETIGSLMVMRKILDHARSVDEAVDIIESYNIDMQYGPPIHYLIAAPSGRSVLVEFINGKMVVIDNENPWHLATTYLRASDDDSLEGICWRYDTINRGLSEADGQINMQEAFDLLDTVSQDITQWSIVYSMSTRELHVTMGRDYKNIHYFNFDFTDE